MTVAAARLSPLKTTLPNGAVVIAKDTRKSPAVTLNIAVRAGTICDPFTAPGAMHLLSRVIDRGTASRGAADIADELDGCGVSLTTVVTRHLFTVSCTCLTEDFVRISRLLADVLMNPVVPDGELSTRKGEVITSLRQDEDSPAIRATEELMALLYGSDHPYGRRAKGTIQSVERLDRQTLLRLHADRFAPSHLSVVVVGAVEAQGALDVMTEVFGEWKSVEPPAVQVARPQTVAERRRLLVPMMNKAQADIAYGFTTIRRADPSYHAFSLLNNALGQYAMGGRLGDSIRERQGMAYYVSSSLSANVAEGPLTIRAGVSSANVDRAIQSIDDELDRLLADGLTAQELSESRRYLIGSLPRSLETNAGIAQFLQSAEFFGVGLDYDLRLPGLLEAVTGDQVHELARRYLSPQQASIVIAGPYEDAGPD
jgi:zinc protease